MNQEEKVSASDDTMEHENDIDEPEEAEPEVEDENESDSSSDSSVEDAVSMARRLQEFEDENVEVFRSLFLQVRSIAENLSNTIREISMGIAQNAAIVQENI